MNGLVLESVDQVSRSVPDAVQSLRRGSSTDMLPLFVTEQSRRAPMAGALLIRRSFRALQTMDPDLHAVAFDSVEHRSECGGHPLAHFAVASSTLDRVAPPEAKVMFSPVRVAALATSDAAPEYQSSWSSLQPETYSSAHEEADRE